ncbi:MAG: thiol-disulfide oxidoreductase DCC family protein [Oceanipulchritudo sp.]
MSDGMKSGQLLVFYDGQCPFCVGWVKFLLDRDGEDRLRFASLQSDWTRRFFGDRGLEHPGLESVVVWDGERIRTQSEAALALAEALPGVWSLGRHLDILPDDLRNRVYGFIADKRYKWFGKYEQCWTPKPADRIKFEDLPETQKGENGDT